MSDNPPPVFARDYIRTAQITSLGYMAARLKTLPLAFHATGDRLADYIRNTPEGKNFTPAELAAFAKEYRFIGSTSPGTGAAGGDAVAFQNIKTGSIFVGVAGINDNPNLPWKDGLQTDAQTAFTGANGKMYADVQSFVFGLMNTYKTSNFDFGGHSAGGPIVQLLTADASLRGISFSSRIITKTTFGSFGINFNHIFDNGFVSNFSEIIKELKRIEHGAGFVHFRNDSDVVPKYSDLNLYRLAGPEPIILDDGFADYEGLPAHKTGSYIGSLRPDRNNLRAVIPEPSARPDAIAALGQLFGVSAEQADTIVVTARRRPDGSLSVLTAAGRKSDTRSVDPVSGALLPRNLQRVTYPDGSTRLADTRGRTTEYVVREVGGVMIVTKSISSDGNLVTVRNQNGVEQTVPRIAVIKEYSVSGRVTNSDIKLAGNPVGFDFGDVGSILGTQLGYRLASGNQLVGVITSSALKTFGDNFGTTLDSLLNGGSVNDALKDGFEAIGDEFLANLKSAGVGAVSAYLTAELINAIGIDGFGGELANSAGGAIIGQIASNLVTMAGSNPAGVTAFSNIGAALGSAAGSFLGAKLASLVWQPGTIGGQIGAAVGSALAPIGVNALLASAGLALNPIGFAVVVFVGFLLGGLIGSVFGGTPRSGADALWDDAQGKFIVANVYARKGGSKDAARSLASVAAETFNAVLDATGGRLARPGDVTTGNYGMRKSDYVYRPTSTQDSNLITYRVSTKDKDAFAKITGYGIYKGLTDPDFQIIGGSNYIKRAVYATLEIGGVGATNFDQSALFGNIASAQAYESYLSNSAVINAIVAAESDSVFAIETAINLARAVELGLTKRHRSDWFGGFNALLTEAGTNAARVEFGYDYDPFSGQISRQIGVGDYVIGDTIDIAGQTTIEAGAAADIIDLRSGKLANQIGYTVNGTLNNAMATAMLDIDVAATVDGGDGNDTIYASNLGDNIFGGADNDTLYGGRLDDWLLGGDGDDVLDAGTADQAALGGDGNYLDGGAGNDVLIGTAGNDNDPPEYEARFAA